MSLQFNDGKVDAVEIAQIAQYAENVFFGKPCGLMDQMASSVGSFVAIDFNVPKKPIIDKVNFDFASSNHALCIVDTGGNHANLTQDYADITLECKAVSNALGVEFLRDATEEDFYNNIAEIRKKCGDRAVLRAIHVFCETSVYLPKNQH